MEDDSVILPVSSNFCCLYPRDIPVIDCLLAEKKRDRDATLSLQLKETSERLRSEALALPPRCSNSKRAAGCLPWICI